jgi:hypothetical protein
MFRSPKALTTSDVESTVVEAANERDKEMSRLRVVGSDAYPDWEAVYADNVERLYRLMYARVGNRPDAEDLTS